MLLSGRRLNEEPQQRRRRWQHHGRDHGGPQSSKACQGGHAEGPVVADKGVMMEVVGEAADVRSKSGGPREPDG